MMKRLLLLTAALVLSANYALARAPLTLACEDGNKTVVISGLSGTPKVMGSYPSCTITVYAPGTTNLSTLYADNVGTPLANPFIALTTGWFTFYADNGCYDVRRSGAVPTPFSQPFCIFDSTGFGSGGYNRIQDEGLNLTQRQILNFKGTVVTCIDDAGNARTNCTFTGGGSSGYDTVQDEGVPLTQRTKINFTGSGVTCTDDAGNTRTNCAIPGGGVSSGWVDGGNSFSSTTPSIGNINNKNMAYITNNLERFRITSSGSLLFGVNSIGVAFTNTSTNGAITWPKAYVKEDTNPAQESIGIGDGVTDTFSYTLRHFPIQTSSVSVFVDHVLEGTDDGAGNLTGAGISAGTIVYSTGVINVTFVSVPVSGKYVDVTDTIEGNAFIGSTNADAFTVIPTDISGRALGGDFTITNHVDITTEGSVPANSFFGAIQLNPKSDATDPIGNKKLYQKDSAGNEREFCYKDDLSGCGVGPWWPDYSIRGGFVAGGFHAFASATRTQPFGSNGNAGQYRVPSTFYLSQPVVCISTDAPAGSVFSEKVAPYVFNGSGVDQDAAGAYPTIVPPAAPKGCYQDTRPFPFMALQHQQINWAGLVNAAAASVNITIIGSDVIGKTVIPIGITTGFVIGASNTNYFGIASESASIYTDQDAVRMPLPAGTLRNFCMAIGGTQNAAGSLVGTVMVDAVATSIVITIPGGGVQGEYCSSNTAAVTDGQTYDFRVVNNYAGGNSATIVHIGGELLPTVGGTAIIAFNKNAPPSMTPSQTRYWTSFSGGEPLKVTPQEAWFGMPRDFTVTKLRCWVKTAPGTTNVPITLYKNLAATAMTGTLTTGFAAPALFTITGSVAFNALDGVTMQTTTGTGTAPDIAGCVASGATTP